MLLATLMYNIYSCVLGPSEIDRHNVKKGHLFFLCSLLSALALVFTGVSSDEEPDDLIEQKPSRSGDT